nr:lytic murein transglycosylase B [Oceanicoccus sp. KOV_DT_Chl]
MLVCFALIFSVATSADSYENHPAAKAFVEKMVSDHGFERSYVQQLMKSAERKQSILDAIARPAEKTKTWGEYRQIFVTEKRTRKGLVFMQEYADTLARAERDFGVPAEIIAAIIGVETYYGGNKGSYRVLDALATLGFDYEPRSKFFSKQLEEYLLLVREQKFDAQQLKGSYAGAMGYGQFIPSSYRHYAIDFDGDGVADIVNNPVDAIGSVANYFKSHGWRQGEIVTVTAKVNGNQKVEVANDSLKPKRSVAELQQAGYLAAAAIDSKQLATAMQLDGDSGDEYWLGLQNFYVITRYNHSRMYAMAVYQLSEALKTR